MKKKDFILGFIVVVIGLRIFSEFTESICIIKGITGVPCPGCGMTRAYVALFHGHIIQAFIYHPLFILPIIAIIIYLLKKEYFNKCILVIGIIFLGVYIFRMISLFPNEIPMNYNDNAVIPKIIQGFRYIYTNNY